MMDLKLTGAKELERRLSGLGRKVGRKIVRQALRPGAKIIAEQAKANAQAVVGGDMGAKIAKSIAVRAAKARGRGEFSVRVSVDPSGKYADDFVHVSKSGKRSHIPSALEYGHDNAAAMPFMRPAFDTKSDQAIKTVETGLWKGVQEAAKP